MMVLNIKICKKKSGIKPKLIYSKPFLKKILKLIFGDVPLNSFITIQDVKTTITEGPAQQQTLT